MFSQKKKNGEKNVIQMGKKLQQIVTTIAAEIVKHFQHKDTEKDTAEG
jgi:hypothetical protein